MKDSGTLAEAWLVRRLRTWSRKWHGEGKQEMRGRAAKLFQHVFLFWLFPFPRSPLHNARLREEGEGGKGVRESTRGGHFGEIPPPPLSTLTPFNPHPCPQTLNPCEAFKLLTQNWLLWRAEGFEFTGSLVTEDCFFFKLFLLPSAWKTPWNFFRYYVIPQLCAVSVGWTETCLR